MNLEVFEKSENNKKFRYQDSKEKYSLGLHYTIERFGVDSEGCFSIYKTLV